MNITNDYPADTSEHRMLDYLQKTRAKLKGYKQSKEYRDHGFLVIDSWAEEPKDLKQLINKILTQTDAFPSQALIYYIHQYFHRREDRWQTAIEFVQRHAALINNIRNGVLAIIHSLDRPTLESQHEDLLAEIRDLTIRNKRKHMKSAEFRKAVFPFLMPRPMLKSWNFYYDFHVKVCNEPTFVDDETMDESSAVAPWKSRKKVQHYATSRGWTPSQVDANVNRDGPDSWDLKSQRKLMTHFVGSRYCFVADYMITGSFVYCVAINVNTRKVFFALPRVYGTYGSRIARPRKPHKPDAASAIQSLNDIRRQTPVKFLLMDNEPAWTSNEFQDHLRSNGIAYQFVHKNQVTDDVDTNEKSRLNHSSTSLIDRFIRTVRMMNYNMNMPSEIHPTTMRWLVNEYNNSPHSTLSRYLKRQTTPNEVDANPALERKICSEILRENHLIRTDPNYQPNRYVRVYNDAHSFDKVKPRFLPGHWEVLGTEDGLFKVQQNDHIMKVSRWMIKSN